MPNYYKKPLIFWFGFLIIILTMTLFARCAKPPMASVTTTVIDKHDSISHSDEKNVTNNLAVIDSLKMLIGDVTTGKKECDSVCNVAIQQMMQRIDNEKSSGENKYGILYDHHRRLLIMYQKMAATKNSTEVVKDVKAQKYYYTQRFFITKTVTHTPDYMKWSAWFAWLCIGVLIYKGSNIVRSWILKKFIS